MNYSTGSRSNLRAAVVGGGAFGETHLRTLHSMPGVEIAGVFTLEPSRGKELCSTYGGMAFEHLDQLASDESIDIVTIATPEDRHLESFLRLAAAGKAIYVEKPLATSLDEASAIRDAAKPLIAMSGHCLRFEQRLALMFERLRGVPKHHLAFRNRRTRHEKETYGRVHPAFAMMCHEIELANAFAEVRFRRVMALETRFSEGQADGLSVLIEYESGATASVECGWFLPAQVGCIENDLVSVLSAQGIDELAIPHQGYFRITPGGMEMPNLLYGNSVYGTEYGPLRAAFDYFVKCVAECRPPEISTIEDGFQAIVLIEAALRSVRENRWVGRNELGDLQ